MLEKTGVPLPLPLTLARTLAQDKLRDQAAAIPMPMRRPPSDDKAAKHGLTRSRTPCRRPACPSPSRTLTLTLT